MIDCDLLLSWMTHTREGSWTKFRSAVEELTGIESDLSDLCRALRINLSDLGFADFFVDGTQCWRMLPPLLGGLSAQGIVATLCGSRTPALIDSLNAAASGHHCRLDVETVTNCPALVRVSGPVEQLAVIAEQIGVSFEPDLSATLARELKPIPDTLGNAPQEPAPLNWKVRSFDFGTCIWVDRLLLNTACEFTPTYGRSKYFVHQEGGKLLRVSKRESLYAAAILNEVQLVEYDPASYQLKVPLFAPLPELYSRVACLCSGRLSDVVAGRITYGAVPPDLAAVLMLSVGQPHPRRRIRGRNRELLQ